MEFDANLLSATVCVVIFFRLSLFIFNTSLNCVTFECPDNRLPYALLVNSFVKMSYYMLYMNIFLFPNAFVNVHANLIDRQTHDDNADNWMVFHRYVFECDPEEAMDVKMLYHIFHICMVMCAFECASRNFKNRKKWKNEVNYFDYLLIIFVVRNFCKLMLF